MSIGASRARAEQARLKLAIHIAAFIQGGGQIEQISRGTTAYCPSRLKASKRVKKDVMRGM